MCNIFETKKQILQEKCCLLKRLKDKRCPDQCLGIIGNFSQEEAPAEKAKAPKEEAGFNRENIDYIALSNNATNNKNFKDEAKIILILESPHIAEFKNEENICPANGTTGRNILSHIKNALSKYLQDNSKEFLKKKLYLINAIQYQCSLGEKPKNHRDHVFLCLWENGGKEDFQERFKSVYSSGDIIINACTKGNNGIAKQKELRRLVQDELTSLNVENIIKLTHPASWYGKYRDWE